MKNGRARSISWMAAVMLLIPALARVSSGLVSGPASPDPLAVEIQRRSAELKQGNQPLLAQAAQDLTRGRRLLALHRLAMAEVGIATGAYLSARPADQHKDMARFEAEWARMGKVLHSDLGPPSPAVLAGVQPAALRALGEAAIPQVRAYYTASLEYGRSTTPGDGLFYLASAQAQRDFVVLCRRLSTPTSLKPPPLRSLRAEIDGLQSELIKAYQPPASTDRHSAFIAADSTLKEARVLDAAGLRYGAMLRYLEAVQLAAPLRPTPPQLAPAALRKRLHEFAARLSAGGIDHSIGRMILEGAQDEVASAPPGTSPAASTVIATDVLPRYFAALAPAVPQPPKPKPQVVITLVRWPYT